MEIGVENTTFQTIDKTPYERWISDGLLDNNNPHVIIQRLIKIKTGDDNGLVSINKTICTSPDELRDIWLVENIKDGLYYYQKVLIPLSEHTTQSNNIVWYDPTEEKVVYLDTDEDISKMLDPINDFDDIYEIIRKEAPDNCFYFDDYIFTIYSLVECYILSEREKINNYLQNNCKATCSPDTDLEIKVNILLAAITVLNMLIEKRDFFEALRIFNGINSCGNLCSNFYSDNINKCGCGTV